MQDKKVKRLWYQDLFCCSKQPSKVNKDQTKPEEQIITFEDLCRNNPRELEKIKQLYFNKQYQYYCDKQRRMLTKFSLTQLRISDFQPQNLDQRQIIKYSCPICFRYFNNILKSSCCQNYVCLLCCMEYIQKQQLKICHFCQCENSYYVDVSEEDGLKIYTDSQGLNFAKDMQKENQPQENLPSENLIRPFSASK